MASLDCMLNLPMARGLMKTARNIILWIIGIVAFIFVLNAASESDINHCEVDIAKKLNTTAVYVDGHCMVKGFGRWDGR